jgi:hypothetical protein
MSGGLDVSVVVPFRDDEERAGALARRLAAHLRALGLTFELLFVDEDSRDNSVALLLLLRDRELPELRVLTASGSLGFAVGAQVARGRALWFFDVAQADAPLAPFAWARRRLAEGVDVVRVSGRFTVARRARTWPIVAGLPGRGDAFAATLAKRARRRRLLVETVATREAPLWARLWGALSRA